MKFRLLTTIVFLGTLSSIVAGCSSTSQVSNWSAQPIVANGHDDEWEGKLIYYEQEKIGVGVANDATNLYIAIKTLDRPTMMKIIRTGTTIWLDSTAGGKRNFGIRFPLGIEGSSFARGRRPEANVGSSDDMDTRNVKERLMETLHEIEVIGPNPLDRKRLPTISSMTTHGIKVGLSDTLDAMVYELIVPLHASIGTPLAIGTSAGKTISVGIETTDLRENMPHRAPAPESGLSGGGGMGGMRSGRNRGGFEGSTQPNMEPLKLWIDVTLAKP